MLLKYGDFYEFLGIFAHLFNKIVEVVYERIHGVVERVRREQFPDGTFGILQFRHQLPDGVYRGVEFGHDDPVAVVVEHVGNAHHHHVVVVDQRNGDRTLGRWRHIADITALRVYPDHPKGSFLESAPPRECVAAQSKLVRRDGCSPRSTG